MLSTLLLIVLAACGNNKETNGESKKESGKQITIEHAMGKTKVPEKAKKVVILTNEGTEALLALGIKPAGAVKSFTGDPWYDHIKDKMDGVEVVGLESEINMEAIAAIKPDLIIGNKMRQEKQYDQLSEIAPTVFAETLRGDWQENFKLYAKAVNKEEKGQQVLDDYNKHVQEVKDAVGDNIQKKISMVRFMPGDVRIYHKDTFSGVILDQVGFARAPGQDVNDFAERNLTKERMSAMDGDVMFYFTYDEGNGEGNKLEEEWTADPLFKNLSVSKNGNVKKVNDAIWNTAGGILAANIMLDELKAYFVKQ
ncbi:ABC transporter substrate-binding protein [Peribacillus deserti]|uniref:Iron siderophore-binding protein n=1 Tax=Peribacillus deserti TaxID=673318 RepID=A0A2N5M2N8_9BACI|nr:iron-siderophore ABC transporter substrate-binding protein [Peribacillus deserti]PLT28636.1 iron siderophore-binding protein [Peribacillus deserti]